MEEAAFAEGRGLRPATKDGATDFVGVEDLQAHAARPAVVTQQGFYPYDYALVPAAPVLALGATGTVPGSLDDQARRLHVGLISVDPVGSPHL
jgi:hypothetical protein